MNNSSFDLVQSWSIIRNRWKTLVLYILLSVVVATAAVFILPPYYKSTALIVSANTTLADKGRLFNGQIQGLYSYFGNGDDLDRIYGIADMDITYKRLVDEFSLIVYYEIEKDSLPLQTHKAIKNLRKDLTLQKTEQGQLKIVCWTKDKFLSANIVNRLTAILEETEKAIWQKNYRNAYDQMNRSILAMDNNYQALTDSSSHVSGTKHDLVASSLQVLLEQIKQYRKTADEIGRAHV